MKLSKNVLFTMVLRLEEPREMPFSLVVIMFWVKVW